LIEQECVRMDCVDMVWLELSVGEVGEVERDDRLRTTSDCCGEDVPVVRSGSSNSMTTGSQFSTNAPSNELFIRASVRSKAD